MIHLNSDTLYFLGYKRVCSFYCRSRYYPQWQPHHLNARHLCGGGGGVARGAGGTARGHHRSHALVGARGGVEGGGGTSKIHYIFSVAKYLH